MKYIIITYLTIFSLCSIAFAQNTHSTKLNDSDQQLTCNEKSPIMPSDITITTLTGARDADVVSIGTKANGEWICNNGSWTHQEKETLKKDEDISTSAVSGDGHTVIIATKDKGVFLYTNYNEQTSLNPIVFPSTAQVTHAALSTNGLYAILSTVNGKVFVGQYNQQAAEYLWKELPMDDATTVVISADGQHIIVGTTNGAAIFKWNKGTWQETQPQALKDKNITTAAISTSGQAMNIGTANSGDFNYYDTDNKFFRVTDAGLPSDAHITHIAMSASGNTINIGTEQGDFNFYHGVWGNLTSIGLPTTTDITSNAVSPDGTMISVTTNTGQYWYFAGIRWHNLNSSVFKLRSPAESVLIYNDKNLMLYTTGKTFYYPDPQTPWVRFNHIGYNVLYARPFISANEQRIVVGSNTDNFHLYSHGHWIKFKTSTTPDKHELPPDTFISTFQLSQNGKMIALGTLDGEYLWENNQWIHATGKNYAGLPANAEINGSSISKDGKVIAVSTRDYGVYIGIGIGAKKEWHHLNVPLVHGTTTEDKLVSVAADGNVIIIGTPKGAFFVIISGSKYALIPELRDHRITTTAISANGQVISVGTVESGEYVWRNLSWHHITKAIGGDGNLPKTAIISTAMSSDGSVITVGTNTDGPYLFFHGVWKHILKYPKQHDPYGDRNYISNTNVSSNGGLISISTLERKSYLYNTMVNIALRTPFGSAFSQTGHMVITCNSNIPTRFKAIKNYCFVLGLHNIGIWSVNRPGIRS